MTNFVSVVIRTMPYTGTMAKTTSSNRDSIIHLS